MLGFPLINVMLASFLWWTSVVWNTWLISIILKALPHIFSLSHSRSCPDPASQASVIGPGDELLLCGPKFLSRSFCAPLELREEGALLLWKSVRVWSWHQLYLPVHGRRKCADEGNEAWETGIRGRGMESWWNRSLASVSLVIPLPNLDPGPVNSPSYLASSNRHSIICSQKSPV